MKRRILTVAKQNFKNPKEGNAMNIEAKKKNHVKKYETLKKIILAVGMCENMSEQEIRKNLLRKEANV